MEVLPGAVKLPPAVAERLHEGAPGANYFGLVKLEAAWRERAGRVLRSALGAALGGVATLAFDAPGLAVAGALLLGAGYCLLRSRGYGRKAASA